MTDKDIRAKALTIIEQAKTATTWGDLSKAERAAEDLERNAGQMAPLVSSVKQQIRSLQRSLEDDWDRTIHKSTWTVREGLKRIL